MQLLLLHYNNYFNRIIKKKDTITDYKSADAGYKEVSNINFNPGDGVNTSIVLVDGRRVDNSASQRFGSDSSGKSKSVGVDINNISFIPANINVDNG